MRVSEHTYHVKPELNRIISACNATLSKSRGMIG